jgi:hypothetical protein
VCEHGDLHSLRLARDPDGAEAARLVAQAERAAICRQDPSSRGHGAEGLCVGAAATYVIGTLVTGCTLLPINPVARTRSPVSSSISRTAASSGDSLGSTFPPGETQGGVLSRRLPTRTPRRLVTTAGHPGPRSPAPSRRPFSPAPGRSVH